MSSRKYINHLSSRFTSGNSVEPAYCANPEKLIPVIKAKNKPANDTIYRNHEIFRINSCIRFQN